MILKANSIHKFIKYLILMNSPLSQTHAFVEKTCFTELEEDKVRHSIYINKCRKSTL